MKKTFWDGHWHWVNGDGSAGERCPPPTDEERAAEDNERLRAKYQKQADDTGQEVWWRGEKFVPGFAFEPPPPPPKRKAGTKEYRVITQRDDFFKGKFDPEKLQALLNRHADDGWRVVSMAATDVGSWWGSFLPKGGGAQRQELVVLLERTFEE
jgi:hypothetical protein